MDSGVARDVSPVQALCQKGGEGAGAPASVAARGVGRWAHDRAAMHTVLCANLTGGVSRVRSALDNGTVEAFNSMLKVE